jgi:DNA-binding CsgD family transcriptional regulator
LSRARLDGLRDATRQTLGAAATEALITEGGELSAHEAVAYALGLYDGDEQARPAGPAASQTTGQSAGQAEGDPAPAVRPQAPDTPPGSPRATANGSSAGNASRGRAAPLPGLVSSSGTLTAREMEIARLIARGLSNRGIADELTISPATAARHVANIFGKLGFTSRAQVAAWAAEREHGTHR